MVAKCTGPYVELVVHGLGTSLVHGPKDLTPFCFFFLMTQKPDTSWCGLVIAKRNRRRITEIKLK